MKIGSGKSKGSSYERNICKKLSLWLSDGDDDSGFWRTSNSGGRHTIRLKKGKKTKNQDGDITSIYPEFDWFSNFYSIECKTYKDLNIWSLLINLKGDNLKNFWKQTLKQADDSSKYPMLIAKQNQKPDIIVLSALSKNLIEGYFGRFDPVLIVPDIDMNIYILKDILELDSKVFKKMIEKDE